MKSTYRYCPGCDKTTEWKYVEFIGHSRCVECGGTISFRNKRSALANARYRKIGQGISGRKLRAKKRYKKHK